MFCGQVALVLVVQLSRSVLTSRLNIQLCNPYRRGCYLQNPFATAMLSGPLMTSGRSVYVISENLLQL